jgi:hypothetical protein
MNFTVGTYTDKYQGTPIALSPNSNLAAGGGATIANGGISNTDAFSASYSYFAFTASMKLNDKLQVRLGVTTYSTRLLSPRIFVLYNRRTITS